MLGVIAELIFAVGSSRWFSMPLTRFEPEGV
jgi:hypothetical protein